MPIGPDDLQRLGRDWSAPPSWAAFRVTATLRSFCLWMADWLAPPPLLLAEKATGFAQSQVQHLKDMLVTLQARSDLTLLQNAKQTQHVLAY